LAVDLSVSSVKDNIPEDLFRQMTTCQTAANEFLRQFWSSIYPPPADLPTLAVASPAQRATKAAKMITYISKTREKVDALLRAARLEGIDPTSVETVSGFVCKSLDRSVFNGFGRV
jgi:transcription initiation factor TFIIH subunit 1